MFCSIYWGINIQYWSDSSRKFQFGVAQSDWQYHAYNASKPDKVKPFKDLRAVFSYPEPFQIIARKGSKIKDWNSLKGKKVNIGNPGSGQRGT